MTNTIYIIINCERGCCGWICRVCSCGCSGCGCGVICCIGASIKFSLILCTVEINCKLLIWVVCVLYRNLFAICTQNGQLIKLCTIIIRNTKSNWSIIISPQKSYPSINKEKPERQNPKQYQSQQYLNRNPTTGSTGVCNNFIIMFTPFLLSTLKDHIFLSQMLLIFWFLIIVDILIFEFLL